MKDKLVIGGMAVEKEKARNLKITGSGSSPGGLYQKVTIVGEGTVGGDIDSVSCKTQGTSRFAGNVKCETFHVSGTAEIEGKLQAEHMKVFGETKIGGSLLLKEARIRGSVEMDEGLTAESIDLRGNVSVGEDCEAETFSAKGGFTIGGLLNAGNIEVRLKYPSHAKEIGGEKISIERDNLPFGLNKITKSGSLSVDTVEGDDIYLEYVTAKIVRGNNVRIGPGCEINLVEYQTSFNADKKAIVKEHRKL